VIGGSNPLTLSLPHALTPSLLLNASLFHFSSLFSLFKFAHSSPLLSVEVCRNVCGSVV
jgi:hypothetical protein